MKKKQFEWTLEDFSERNIKFKLEFKDPSFVNKGQLDKMQVIFNNTEKYLVPNDENDEDMLPVPNGFMLPFTLPSQNPDIFSEE